MNEFVISIASKKVMTIQLLHKANQKGIYEEKTLIFSLLATLGLVCVGGWYFISQNQAQAVKAEARKTFIQSSRPTIFFHGWELKQSCGKTHG